MKQDGNNIKISVRNLVEFLLRSGDIDTSKTEKRDPEAMQKGSKLHRKIQKRMGTEYQAEYALEYDIFVEEEEISFTIQLQGRADGLIYGQDPDAITVVDEIKGMYLDVMALKEPVPVHLAQAKCYAYMYAKRKKEKRIGVQMTYANLESEVIRYFRSEYSIEELECWFNRIINQYKKWAKWQIEWRVKRQESLKRLSFPYEYRPGQKKLVKGVYQSILREKNLYIEAPTGVGKTLSTIFPTLKAMGEELVTKVFYLTAKTITRSVAENALMILREQQLKLKSITITAKEKMCICEEMSCNPEKCPVAEGHYDRVNDAIYAIITKEENISRKCIMKYAKDYKVCPYEFTLDISLWVDVVICDYNYVFDPNVYLRRYFANDKKNDYIYLIDEAHNLVERAKKMYSATLIKEDFLSVKKKIPIEYRKVIRRIQACNTDLLELKRECNGCEVIQNISPFVMHVMRLVAEMDLFLQEAPLFEDREEILNFYFSLYHFLNMYELYDEKYITYVDSLVDGRFSITLQCMDPSNNLSRCLEKVKNAIFFSATLLPIQYYKEQLAGREGDYAIYADSPFDKKNRLIMIGSDVSTKYSNRTKDEYCKIIRYIKQFTEKKVGNYLVFFSSYAYMENVYTLLLEQKEDENEKIIHSIILQESNMTEEKREQFLLQFKEKPKETKIGFCVLGGVFSEGIDLKGERLIGTIIVGPGLPMVCNENELFRNYFEEKNRNGFAYSYLYQGMNKVLQSAGRVIRTVTDYGIILLLDERFMTNTYQKLFPREWFPYEVVTETTVGHIVKSFWDKWEEERKENL